MDDAMRKILDGKDKSPLHEAFLTHCLEKLKRSRRHMQSHYANWDKANDVYMHRRAIDKNDAEALRQGLPNKIVVPMASSQLQVGIAFCYMLFTQRPRFFEFDPTEDADRPLRECGEQLVHRDMLATEYKRRLVQSLLDIFRFGMGVEKDCWQIDSAWMPISTPGEQPMYNGQPTGDAPIITKVEKVTLREGNQIRSISPYRTFTDPSFHISDWRRGDFVATDEEYSKTALLSMQADGDVVGVDHIEAYSRSNLTEMLRDNARFTGIDLKDPTNCSSVVITELIIKLNPAEIVAEGNGGGSLGEDAVPHNWLVWIANDNRIVRAEPMRYLHGQYPVSIGMFMPDMHEQMLNSLSYMVQDLQGLISWFLNSRIAAVTRTVDNQLVVDPMAVFMEDVQNRQRIIRMKQTASGKDSRRFVNQLQVQDTTTGHVADIQNLTSLMQTITGVNENMMGQYNGGRRSATEARSTMAGASARMKLVADIIWTQMYQPQGNRLLINHRQSVSPEEFVNVCGQAKAEYFEGFRSTPKQLARSFDYTPYDGTLPSDKLFLAQQLQDLLGLIMSNPMASAAFNIDPNKVLKDIGTLRGMGQFGNYGYDQVPTNLIAALAMQNGPATGPTNTSPGTGAS